MQEEVLDFLRDLQIRELRWVVSAHERFFGFVFWRLLPEGCGFGSSYLVFLHDFVLRGDDVFFLARFDVFAVGVVHFEGHVEVLVLDLRLRTCLRRSGFAALLRRRLLVVVRVLSRFLLFLVFIAVV